MADLSLVLCPTALLEHVGNAVRVDLRPLVDATYGQTRSAEIVLDVLKSLNNA